MSYRRKSMLKVIILGDSNVGKTSVMTRFVKESFSTQFKATIGADFLSKEVQLKDNLATMQIWDTAGQERFATLGVAFYRGADAVVLVYDVSDPISFKNLEKWKTDFLSAGSPTKPNEFPFIIFGNKCDLPPQKKKIYAQDAQKWCQEQSNGDPYSFFETSAKTNNNIEQAFRTVAELAVNYNQKIDGDTGYKFNQVDLATMDKKPVSRDKNCACELL